MKNLSTGFVNMDKQTARFEIIRMKTPEFIDKTNLDNSDISQSKRTKTNNFVNMKKQFARDNKM